MLVRVDFAMNARATPVGPASTGLHDIFGLGFWVGRVFGFTGDGEMVTLDVATGRATVVDTCGVSWAGAGVTTSAPIIIE